MLHICSSCGAVWRCPLPYVDPLHDGKAHSACLDCQERAVADQAGYEAAAEYDRAGGGGMVTEEWQ